MRVPALALLVSGLLAAGVAVAGPASAATRIPVSTLPSCPSSAAPACSVLANGGTATIVDGPDGGGGQGYLRLTTPTTTSKATVYGTGLGGMPLRALTQLSYRTLVETPGSTNDQQAPSFNIEINPNKAGATYATLVWEPIYTGTRVTPGQWQTWTPSNGRGGWWSTRAEPLVTGQPNKWGFRSYTASFADVLAALPDAQVLGISINQGSGSPGLQAGIDGVTVNDTVYDVEVGPPSADVAVTVGTLPATLAVGAQAGVDITVANRGPSTTQQVRTVLSVPAGLRIAAAPGALALPQSAVFTTPVLAAGASITYRVTLTGVARGDHWLTLATRGSLADPDVTNNVIRPTLAVR